MKRIFIALTLVVFSGSLLLATGQSRTPSKQRLVISQYGTLLDILDANGKSRFGRHKGDGFAIAYKVKDKEGLASARGATDAKGLVKGKIKYYGRTASVSVMTEDKMLQITSYFILNERRDTITILRRITNKSGMPLQLNQTRHYLDPVPHRGFGSSRDPNRGFPGFGRRYNGNYVDVGDLVLDFGSDCECEEEPPPCTTGHCSMMTEGVDVPTTVISGDFELANCPCEPQEASANSRCPPTEVVDAVQADLKGK